MFGRDSLSDAEHAVLLACVSLGDDAYAVSIRRFIGDETGFAPPLSSVYAALDRLAARALVTAFAGESTAVRGGRAKRCYRLTAAGLKAVRSRHRALVRLGVKALEGARA